MGLYDSLEKFYGINGEIARYNELNKWSEISLNVQPQIPESDLKIAVRNLITLVAERNPILRDAVKGRKTVRKKLEELAEINGGVRSSLPHRKNEEHNHQVEYMEELIGRNLDGLKTKGIFARDNELNQMIDFLAFPSIVIGGIYLATYLISPERASTLSMNGLTLGWLFFALMRSKSQPKCDRFVEYEVEKRSSEIDDYIKSCFQ